jgi:hypothetical protein
LLLLLFIYTVYLQCCLLLCMQINLLLLLHSWLLPSLAGPCWTWCANVLLLLLCLQFHLLLLLLWFKFRFQLFPIIRYCIRVRSSSSATARACCSCGG